MNLLRILGADTPLPSIDAEAVDRFIATRRADLVPHTERMVTSSTIGKELSTLRGALRLARRRGLYPYDHTAVMPIGWSDDYEPRKRHPSTDELAKLLAALRPHRAAHVAFLVATGADIGESFAVTRADVDTTSWEITLRGTKTKYRAATVPISPLGREILAVALERVPQKTGPLFEPWLNVRRDLAVAAKKAGVPYYSPKDLRRACASWLVQKGVDLFAVSKVLRHGSTRMVEKVYGHHAKGTLRAVIEQQLAIALPTPKAAVTRLCQTGGYSCDPSDTCDSGDALDRAEIECPGTESNCRHADFQGGDARTRGASKRARRLKVVRLDVAGLCPAAPTEPAGPVFGAMRLAVAAALAGDAAGTHGAMLEAGRALGVLH